MYLSVYLSNSLSSTFNNVRLHIVNLFCKSCISENIVTRSDKNKAGYAATLVACRWAGALIEVTRPFGLEQWRQKIKIMKK